MTHELIFSGKRVESVNVRFFDVSFIRFERICNQNIWIYEQFIRKVDAVDICKRLERKEYLSAQMWQISSTCAPSNVNITS